MLVLLLAFVCASGAMGQKVTGDKYKALPYGKKDVTVTTENTAFQSDHGQIEVVYDGSKGDNSDWCRFELGDNKKAIIEFKFKEAITINGMQVQWGGNNLSHAQKVEIYTSTNAQTPALTLANGNSWIFEKALESITDLRLVLTPQQNNNGNEFITIHEIDFLGACPTIQHKPAKWHNREGNFVDSFEDDIEYFTKDNYPDYGLKWADDLKIQAAHTSFETVYVEKGDTVSLILPEYRSDNGTTNIGSYQRWYDFRTDGTFNVNSSDGVVDLLTPKNSNATYYRFANGYVNRPLVAYSSTLPAWMVFYYPENGDKDYWVACDVSGYMDFTSDGSRGTFGADETYYEPTLAHRVIFHVIGVEDGAPSRTIEEYEINFPAYTYPNKSNEMVALSMDAQSYLAGMGQSFLTVSLEDNTAGIALTSSKVIGGPTNETVTIAGIQRAIYFQMPNEANDGTRYVDGLNSSTDPSATIVVKAGTKEVARFKLNFRSESRLLTQTMVKQLNDENQTFGPDVTWGHLRYRTPENLQKERILLTDLNFDYETAFASGDNKRFYPYPLAWESNSYGFYDGSRNGDFMGGNASNYYFPEYSSYSLLRSTNGYVETDPRWGWRGGFVQGQVPSALLKNSSDEESTFHLFVDASDRPGTIARLPFEEELCPGAVLYVSAWVKSARWGSTNDNAAILFTILGVREDGTTEPIARHQTGQIPAAYENSLNETNLSIPGLSENEWMQTYFSFTNTASQELDFDHYLLQVDNNSPSTGGGDMYIDDIRVYVARPMAEVKQLRMACTNERTLMNLRIDWERLCQRIDVSDPIGDGELGICFIDTLVFHNTYAVTRDLTTALNAAVVKLGESEDNTRKFRMLHYHNSFGEHEKYDENTPGTHVAAENSYYFYGMTDKEDGTKYLSVDFYGDLVPNRAYWVVMVTGNIEANENSEITNTSIFTYFYTDPCALVADFKVRGDALIKVNGEIITPETEFCRGNVHNFTVDLRVPVNGSYATVVDGIYYDWFFGTTNDPLTEYQNESNEYGVSLQDALRVFRNIYPDVTELDFEGIAHGDGVVDNDENEVFTDNMYNLIKSYLDQSVVEGGQNKPLVLHQPNLSVTLRSDLHLVVCPIPTKVPPEGLGITEAEWESANICWGYNYLELRTTGNAPTVHAGFNITDYPKEGYDPSLRIGLEQIRKASTENDGYLVVDLRGVQSYDPDKNTQGNPEYGNFYLRKVHTLAGVEDEQYGKIYLTHTTDPEIQVPADEPLALPIGELLSLNAYLYTVGTTERASEMRIRFNLEPQLLQIGGEDNVPFTFNPREGYEYTFSIYCEEAVEGATGGQAGTACIGTFPIIMKVVPEYLIWDGTPSEGNALIGNWNNDGNWKRVSTGDRIHKLNYDESNKTENGYVPMLFSKVIMPRNSQVYLYAAGYNNRKWLFEERPDEVDIPTQNIQYDLMAFDKDETDNELTTERYRVALCDEIHFEPGAEMLYAEYLLYKKAWVDYELKDSQWHLLASPLQGVVAGDFYTDRSGKEESEYFEPIEFDLYWQTSGGSSGHNSRYQPSVYQRGWKGSATLITVGGSESEGGKNRDVAVSGNWSGIYNNVAEPYTPGTGFSLRVQDLPDGTDKALFRLPKADDHYIYSNFNGLTVTGGEVQLESKLRENAGRLRSDDIYTRSESNPTYTGGSVEHKDIFVTLSESANGDYYLVGNPFMAHLNMKKFFEKNSDVLESKYWYVEDGEQNIAVTNLDDATWTTASDNSLIPPLHSFFVKKSSTDATNVTITFTHEMQALGNSSTSESEDEAGTQALMITATNSEGKMSRALVAADAGASDEYRSAEDAELFLDSNLGDVPMVYTVAGTMATTINVRPTCERVPLAVYSSRDEEVALRFEGVESFTGARLYDAKEKRYTPLTNGLEARIRTNDFGRYFLTDGLATENETIHADGGIQIYALRPGELVVASPDTPLRSIRVFGVNGALILERAVKGRTTERLSVPRGQIYVIYAEDEQGIIQNKKLYLD